MTLRQARKILDAPGERHRQRTVVRACRRLDYAHRETVRWLKGVYREERYADGGIRVTVGDVGVYLVGM